ncbi:hypothetical protein HUA74_42535 [Myxococcus sp. CA051A]|uniref:hypothetical protein n=1 Tax=unclassified Myxococcus TaxID=2648731 RepID=UPI00157AD315|nr:MULTISPECIES: hypothetical protein [unclassified Myxococcus]NTX07787.1 hypothetical protein [Myxococcus sp. CA040A]NTX16019.1 hypothetical protein [Myxococcus sp. CA056]NTX40990.1 hypothetical protein [Myxococcus sp. CA033]NTX52458.1 hypothetical protein [Myxococcus sp. CA039A]NTX67349.1 hypothetical protein [Myxococcus sp. CA051A]
MTPRRIRLHIDELVLHGIAPAHREQVGEAVRQELTRLLATEGLPQGLAGGEVARLDAGAVHVTPHAAPQSLGAQVARAVYSGLGQGK